MFSISRRLCASTLRQQSASPSQLRFLTTSTRHQFAAPSPLMQMMTRHFASKPNKGQPNPPPPPRATKGNKSESISSRPTPTGKAPGAPSPSVLAAKKVVDEIIADKRYERANENDDDDDYDENDENGDDEPPSREELLRRSRAGFDDATIAQLRRWLPRDDQPISSDVAAKCAQILNRLDPDHLDVVNMPAMHLMRIIAEADWYLFPSPTKRKVLLAFSSIDAYKAFTPSLPESQMQHKMKGYEVGALIIDNEDTELAGIAFDAPGIQRLKPSLAQNQIMVLIHYSDSIFFEKWVALADPTAPVLRPDPDGTDEYDPRVLWHRSYVIGAIGGDDPNAAPEDMKLLSDSEDRIIVFSAPDHVAEAISDAQIMPLSLSAEELIGLLEAQKTGISIVIGADCDMDNKPPRHKSVTWTNEQALSILNGSRPKPGEEGYGELDDDYDGEEDEVEDAEIVEPEPVKKQAAPKNNNAPPKKPRGQ